MYTHQRMQAYQTTLHILVFKISITPARHWAHKVYMLANALAPIYTNKHIRTHKHQLILCNPNPNIEITAGIVRYVYAIGLRHPCMYARIHAPTQTHSRNPPQHIHTHTHAPGDAIHHSPQQEEVTTSFINNISRVLSFCCVCSPL